ncbi:MAG: DciA family protein [Patescibacteria group bacterium]|nr:DciA family protein [Patescibacteria group bacterium]
MLIHIKKLLDEAVKRAGITQSVNAARVVEEFNRVCRELYGKLTCDAVAHVSFRNGIVRVSCGHAVVAQNLQFNKSRLINEINRGLKAKAVSGIKITIA